MDSALNRPVEDWGKLLADVAAVTAMLDRILHHGHVLKCGPRSWRTKTAAATAGGLCFFHANPNKATELGPLGGRSHHRPADGNADSLPTLDCATVQDKIDRLMAGVLTGKIPPRVAAALTTLLALKLRVIEATKFEVRTEKLQKFADEVVDLSLIHI